MSDPRIRFNDSIADFDAHSRMVGGENVSGRPYYVVCKRSKLFDAHLFPAITEEFDSAQDAEAAYERYEELGNGDYTYAVCTRDSDGDLFDIHAGVNIKLA